MKGIKKEITEWFRAFLRAIPGRIGETVRASFYGFHCGAKVRVLSNVTVYHPHKLIIGNGTGIAAGCQLNAAGGITIGNDVLIGPGTLIWSQNHLFQNRDQLIRQQGTEYAEISIEDDVWIGGRCVILPGVRLTKGTVVAAGAVVTKSTEPYSIVAGVPAKRVGERVADQVTQRRVERGSKTDNEPLK